MRETLGKDSILGSSVLDDALNLAEDPVGGLKAVLGLVVAGVEAGELLEIGLHVGLIEGFGELVKGGLLDALLGESYGGLGVEVVEAESLGFGDVHKLLAILGLLVY